MWLIGRYTEERTRERWLALRLLSTHFLDVVRGLPTLRALQPQPRAGRDDRARWASATGGRRWGRCASRFLSGSVLELAATLGVALVAVTVGVRLVDGGLGLAGRADGARARARAVPAAAPARRAVPRERRRARRRRAHARRCSRRRRRSRPRARRSPQPAPAARRCASSASRSPTRRGPALVLDGLDLELLPGRDGRARRRERRRQEHGREPAPASRRADRRARHRRRRRPRRAATPTPGGGSSRGCRSSRRSSAARVADNIRLGDADASDARGPRRGRCSPAPTASSGRCPCGYETLVGDGGRPLSAGERAPDRARAGVPARRAARRSSTSRPPTSTRTSAERRRARRSSGCARAARCS